MAGRPSIAVALASLLLLIGSVPSALAGSPGSSTLVVDDDGMASAMDCDAPDLAFETIGAAVLAASSGDTVKVCPGTYPESVVVDKQLQLLGAQAGVGAERCQLRSGRESRITGSPDVGPASLTLTTTGTVVDGFLISLNDGPGISTRETGSGYRIRHNRIRANSLGIELETASSVRSYINRNCIERNNNGLGELPVAGYGIYSDKQLRNTNINNNGFRDHFTSAVFATGLSTSSNISLVRNQSRGDGQFARLLVATKVLLLANRVRGDEGDNDGSAIVIGAPLGLGTLGLAQGIEVLGNDIGGAYPAGIAVRAAADQVLLRGNTVRGTVIGIEVTAEEPGAVVVRSNRIVDTRQDGIVLTDATSQNHVVLNHVSGSAALDCVDFSTGPDTAGTANNWRANTGATSSPAGLCRP
ncbi:hypothetical protein BH20CHL6_BH20CHL6_16800 [soil metagenome]